jgi:hypothetical protein
MMFYYSPKSGRMRWAFQVANMEERKVAYRVLVRKPDGKRPLGRPRHISEDYIKVELQEVRWRRGLDSSGSGQGQKEGYCE